MPRNFQDMFFIFRMLPICPGCVCPVIMSNICCKSIAMAGWCASLSRRVFSVSANIFHSGAAKSRVGFEVKVFCELLAGWDQWWLSNRVIRLSFVCRCLMQVYFLGADDSLLPSLGLDSMFEEVWSW